MVLLVCYICGGELEELGKHQLGYRIYRCLKCGFGQTEGTVIQKKDYHRDKTYILEEALFANIFQKRIKLIERFQKTGRVLEIGCSTGLMLSLLSRDGFEVMGVEISAIAAKRAKKRGIDVVTSPFEKTNFRKKFDLIIFNHTLEHLADPRLVLKKVVGLLNNDGLLYIDLPNFGSVSAKIMGVKWPLLLPEEHPWHFTFEAIQQISGQLGFKILLVNRSSGIWDFDNPVKELWLSLSTFKKRFFSEVLTAIPTFVISKMGLGSGLIIIASKTST